MSVNANPAPRRASLTTLGCRLNQGETLVLQDKLAAAGYTVVPWGQAADLGVINTCTVTRLADAKCRQVIRKFIRENPEAFTAVVGCYSQMGAAEIAGLGGVDLIIGNQDKLGLLDYVGDGSKNAQPVIVREKIDREDFALEWAGELPFNQRANLKVQDGCDFLCSFCIIPFARGRARARQWDDLLAEAHSQAQRGVRELVLTGVNIGTYDHQGRDIVAVVDALAEVPGLDRLRVSSIEPTTVPDALFDRMADPAHPLLPFLHLPLQSGCDRILQAMRRKYTSAEWTDFVAAARQRVPDLYVGTDVMVAFPGETEAEFEETCQLLLEHRIAFAHVFTYSERDGTLAAKWPELAIPVPERQRRSARLRALAQRLRRAWQEAHLGQEMTILCENPREGHAPGYTDNYISCLIPAEDLQRFAQEHATVLSAADLANRRVRARLEHITADFVQARLMAVEG